ncbi:unnamed protein product [Paramecium primaurelia]|uniref:Uncharacterized protein n=1 Tax=Paramecium primaurelia TaxID=5886 RepID=A0A8S1P8Q1_PARPR|nr:unnamed protein product [Paramecium primaurelia]
MIIQTSLLMIIQKVVLRILQKPFIFKMQKQFFIKCHSKQQAELKLVMTIIQQIIKKSTDLDDQIHKDDVFLDEKLYQKKEAILNSLQVVLFQLRYIPQDFNSYYQFQ